MSPSLLLSEFSDAASTYVLSVRSRSDRTLGSHDNRSIKVGKGHVAQWDRLEYQQHQCYPCRGANATRHSEPRFRRQTGVSTAQTVSVCGTNATRHSEPRFRRQTGVSTAPTLSLSLYQRHAAQRATFQATDWSINSTNSISVVVSTPRGTENYTFGGRLQYRHHQHQIVHRSA
jgi:hypothetical protein